MVGDPGETIGACAVFEPFVDTGEFAFQLLALRDIKHQTGDELWVANLVALSQHTAVKVPLPLIASESFDAVLGFIRLGLAIDVLLYCRFKSIHVIGVDPGSEKLRGEAFWHLPLEVPKYLRSSRIEHDRIRRQVPVVVREAPGPRPVKWVHVFVFLHEFEIEELELLDALRQLLSGVGRVIHGGVPFS